MPQAGHSAFHVARDTSRRFKWLSSFQHEFLLANRTLPEATYLEGWRYVDVGGKAVEIMHAMMMGVALPVER
jgi:hypothetical protein